VSRWIENALLALLAFIVILFVTRAWHATKGLPPSADNPATLTVISPHWEGIRYEFKRAFEASWNTKHPEQPVVLVWLAPGGASQITRFIESEFVKHPSGIGVDVFFGGGTTPHEYLNQKGLLDPINLPAEITSAIPVSISGIPMYDPELRWFGAAISGFGIVFNKQVLKFKDLAPPRDWQDLSNPSYIDWIASGDPRSSGSVHTLYEVILQAYGFEKGYSIICGMAGNVRAFDEGGNATPRAVGLGEACAGGSIDFYAFEQVQAYGAENIGFVMPENLTVLNADPISILKGAPNRELAIAFVQFVLSEEGQKLWYVRKDSPGGPVMFGLNRYPVRTDLYDKDLPTAVVGNPYKFRTTLVFDNQKSQARSQVLDDLFKATIFDVHSELRKAWRIVGPSGDGELLKTFGSSPVTEEALLELAKSTWSDPAEKARIMREWTAFASDKFRKLSEAE
jgi:ABC-type Fe3+ transport system substrate-binding protein